MSQPERLILHTAAYWRLWRIQQAIPKAPALLAAAEFATLRLRLLKLAVRVIESASRIRLAFALTCSEAGVFKAIATSLRPAPPWPAWQCRRKPEPSSINLEKPIGYAAVKNAGAGSRPDHAATDAPIPEHTSPAGS